MSDLENNINDAADAAKDAASDVVNTVSDAASNAAGNVAGAASGAASNVADAASGAAKGAANAMNNAAASVSSADNNKLFGALTYPIPLIGIIALVSDSMKNDPVLRKHSVQSLAYTVAAVLVGTILTTITFGIGGCLTPLMIIPPIIWAVQAYGGKDVNIPVITDFCKKQGWF
ncbi:MAG TPA: hypothetical protein PLJ62_00570 [Thermoflexales bacterium]|nr:hypothetical protein [Thermoflexales bacterium]HQZ98666.1 hypothetical protein [Thermoflexales bacterium]